MADTPPIACTLSADDLEDREASWKKLLGSGLVERHLERECCAWIHFEVTDGSVVTMTAEDDGEAVLAELFLVR
ncbi:MAG TPA: hypothetical protein VN965_07445 [Candidatus Dormibacteraeota bacterium]|nr:hypothetical protein [Candidatus Dormibacteraeota bacterium]